MGYGDTKELRNALQKNLDIMDAVTGAVEVDGQNVTVTEEKAATFRSALAEAERIQGVLQDQQRADHLKEWAAQPAAPSAAAQLASEMAALQGAEAKSLGEMFTDSNEFKNLLQSRSATMDRAWELERSDLTAYVGGRKDVHTGSAPAQTTRGLGRTQYDPMVPRAMRTARVRDLFPVANTSANLIDYFRVVGFGSSRLDLTSGARTVAERTAADGISPGNAVFGVKPKSNLTFESAQAPVRTIAHYEVAHRNVLADEPQLQSVINNELLYGLRLEEDRQILQGSGLGEDLQGILTTPGIQAYSQAVYPVGHESAGQPSETKADALRRAATKAILAYYPPSGYVMHPYDWEDVELTKTSEGAYVLATNVAVGAQTQAWRQPVVESPAMPEGTFVTGAWGLGAQLYDRAQASIRIAEQHADFFIRNAVAVLAEQRLAFAVKRPESFVRGTFAA